jgi:hypothetical protein
MSTMTPIGTKVAVFLTAASLLLSACEAARSVAGFEKQPPDEFSVITRAPLSVPPDFGLRPPVPGAERPQEKTVRNQARDVILRDAGSTTSAAPQIAASSGKLSKGEAALLSGAGALNIDPSIRSIVNRETSALVDAEDSVFDKVFFWQEVDPPGSIVDADKESRRLREASAVGDPPNKGEVPVIKREERGILEGIF